MLVVRITVALLIAAGLALSATFGTVVPLVGGAADIILDEPRGRVYLVNTSQTRVEVYSIAQRRFLTSVRTESLPLAAAMSRDGRFLYVTAHDASALNVINLETLQVTNRVSLPVKPEGVAVGADGRVLVSTIGSGQNNASNVLLIYNPDADGSRSLEAVGLTPAPPQSPLVPSQTGGRVFLTSRSQLMASPDGQFIVGINIPNNNQRAVFVYEVASGTVLRSRTVQNASSVLSVAPDGSKFMAGLNLFDTETLQVLATQNAANSPWPFPTGTNFNSQQIQGGSVFAADSSVLFSAFNVAPIQNPAARANVSQLMLNDPDNLLIQMGLQMPENLTGKMVITSDSGTVFALSESGFVIIPVSTLRANPIAEPVSRAALLVNDQCGAYIDRRTGGVEVRNAGRGRFTVRAEVLQTTPAGPGGIGGVGGPGGGLPGGGVVIVVPGAPGGIQVPVPPTLPDGRTTPQNAAVFATAPTIRALNTADSGRIDLTFSNAAAARNPGTVSPSHTILVQANEAVNIPPSVRVFQNFRDAESRGDIVPIEVGLSANEALEDLVIDNTRQRVYIANSGMNRVEVYDIRRRELLPPVKVGQLPRSLAITPDGSTLYVANSGGESVSIVNLDRLELTGRVKFPPLPFNSSAAPMTPSIIASGIRGLQILMNNGTLWKVVGDQAVPRPLSPVIGTTTLAGPVRTMAATPNGEYILVLAGNGFAYLYDSVADDFIQARQIASTFQGYYGPVAAGPRGQYYLANGFILNQALTPIANAGAIAQGNTTVVRPVSAVAATAGNQMVRFVQPVRANANAVAALPSFEVVDVNSGNIMRAVAGLEGPLSTVVGNNRVNINGRTMAVDGTGTTAFALTTSGLSVIPLEPVTVADRPIVNPGGTVNLASYLPAFAPGSLISIFGRNLANSATSEGPAPTLLGGTCVTMGNTTLPLTMTSTGQINAQIPTETAVGRYTLLIRSLDRKTVSLPQAIQVAKYAPAIFTNPETKEAMVFRQDGRPVNRSNPAKRDEPIIMFATGLGVTKPRVAGGAAAPSDTLAESDPVEVFFGDVRYSQAAIIVDWAGLTPGFIGLYQINLRVPGNHLRGDELPVTLRIGGVDSQKSGPAVPTIAVD